MFSWKLQHWLYWSEWEKPPFRSTNTKPIKQIILSTLNLFCYCCNKNIQTTKPDPTHQTNLTAAQSSVLWIKLWFCLKVRVHFFTEVLKAWIFLTVAVFPHRLPVRNHFGSEDSLWNGRMAVRWLCWWILCIPAASSVRLRRGLWSPEHVEEQKIHPVEWRIKQHRRSGFRPEAQTSLCLNCVWTLWNISR